MNWTMPLQAKSRSDSVSSQSAGPVTEPDGSRPRPTIYPATADSANRGPATTADCPGPGGHSPRACQCHVTGPLASRSSRCHGPAVLATPAGHWHWPVTVPGDLPVTADHHTQ
jgi:hypothetical protein